MKASRGVGETISIAFGLLVGSTTHGWVHAGEGAGATDGPRHETPSVALGDGPSPRLPVPGPSAQAEPETPSPHWPDWSVDPERALIYSPLAIDTGWANDIEAPDPDATRAEFERYMEEYRLDYLRTRHDLLVRSLVQLETAKPGRGEYKQLFTYLGLESIAMLQDIERRGHLIFNEEVILSTPEPGLSHRFVSGNSWYEVHVDEYPEFFDIQLDWATSEVPGSALPGFPDTVTRRWDPLPQHAIDQLHYRVGLAIDRFLVIWDQEGGQ